MRVKDEWLEALTMVRAHSHISFVCVKRFVEHFVFACFFATTVVCSTQDKHNLAKRVRNRNRKTEPLRAFDHIVFATHS